MPVVTNTIEITYAGLTVGGASDDYRIDAKYRFDKTYTDFRFEADVVVFGSSEADLTTKSNALEAAFRTPRGAVVMTFGGAAAISLSHDANSALNTEATAVKLGEDLDTAKTRKYRITVSGELPADLAGQAGRRDSSISVSTDPSGIKTVVITGTYTALGGNSATAQYSAAITAFETGVLTAIGGTFERTNDDYNYDDDNKILTFTRTYRELKYNQSAGTLDDTRIKAQTIAVAAASTAPGDSPVGTAISQSIGYPLRNTGNVARPIVMTVQANMAIDSEQTTDLVGIWTSTIRPYLIQVAGTVSTGFAYITDITPNFDFSNNRISANMTIATIQGDILEHTMTVEFDDEKGVRPTPVWAKDVLAYKAHQGPRTVLRRVIQSMRVLAGGALGAALGGGAAPGAGGIPGGAGQGFAPGAGAGIPGGGFAPTIGIAAGNAAGTIAFAGQGIASVIDTAGGNAAGTIQAAAFGAGSQAASGGGSGSPSDIDGAQDDDGAGGDIGLGVEGGGNAKWVRLRDIQRATPLTVGLAGYQVDVVDYEAEVIEQLMAEPESQQKRITTGRR